MTAICSVISVVMLVMFFHQTRWRYQITIPYRGAALPQHGNAAPLDGKGETCYGRGVFYDGKQAAESLSSPLKTSPTSPLMSYVTY